MHIASPPPTLNPGDRRLGAAHWEPCLAQQELVFVPHGDYVLCSEPRFHLENGYFCTMVSAEPTHDLADGFAPRMIIFAGIVVDRKQRVPFAPQQGVEHVGRERGDPSRNRPSTK